MQPGWFAPDEDYHWLYTNYLVEKHTVPTLGAPFSTAELYQAQVLTGEAQYFAGPRTNYAGTPHAVLSRLVGASREPAEPPPRPVLHPPGYYLIAAGIDAVLWRKVAVTRLTAMRYYSAALGALTIYFAWLLASAVLAREWQRLAAAALTALTALQTIMAFSASTMTNDVGVAAALTATLAWCAWMLRGPPVARQGIGLGVLFSIAIMVKATMLSLILVIFLTLAMLWRTYPHSRRELWGIVKWCVAIPAVLDGWWYVRLVIVTHSILGERGSLVTSHVHGPGLLHAPAVAWQWISLVYRSYRFDYNSFEVRVEDVWFWLPVIAMAILAVGFVLAHLSGGPDQSLRVKHRARVPYAAARPRTLAHDPPDDHGRHLHHFHRRPHRGIAGRDQRQRAQARLVDSRPDCARLHRGSRARGGRPQPLWPPSAASWPGRAGARPPADHRRRADGGRDRLPARAHVHRLERGRPDPTLLQAVATFVAAGVISSLFAGPGAGTAGAPLLVFGHDSLAASAAAGLELSITALLAGLLYAVVGGPLFLGRLRQAHA